MKKHWSDDEINILKEYYGKKDTDELLKLLPNRTLRSIQHKVRREQGSFASVRRRLRKGCIPILASTEKAYLAGLIDGEGMITIAFSSKGSRPRMQPLISIANTDENLILRIRYWLKGGSTLKYRPEGYSPKRHALFTLQIARLLDVKFLLEQILPYLIVKKRQSELVLKWCNKRLEGTWRDYDPELFELAKEVRSLHHKGSAKMRE